MYLIENEEVTLLVRLNR